MDQGQHLLLDSLRHRIARPRPLVLRADLEALRQRRVPSVQIQEQVAACLAQNLQHQRSEVDLLAAGLEDLEAAAALEAVRIQRRQVHLDLVIPLSEFTHFVAALTFGQQANAAPVPPTGSQNPPYQITSEKETGQTYTTNFHAISMMPAYRNASFEVRLPMFLVNR